MRLEELNWMDVQSYLKTDDRILLVLGSCEQHGYLSLLTDTKIPMALADAASSKKGVLVAPPLSFGVSPYFLSYPGTISLRSSTFLDVLEDVIRSLYQTGFRRILVLNGHGGNDLGRNKLVELINDLPGLKIGWYAWWTSHSVEAIAMRHELKSAHAAWIEAFPFVQVAELPEGIKIPPAVKGVPGAEETRGLYGDGVFGGAYSVDAAIMEEIFQAALEDVLDLMDF